MRKIPQFTEGRKPVFGYEVPDDLANLFIAEQLRFVLRTVALLTRASRHFTYRALKVGAIVCFIAVTC